MARRDYGFVRSYASLGRDTDDLLNLLASGYSGALFDLNDPYLAQAIADARGAGVPYGIWGDPGNDDAGFIRRMANAYQRYNPQLLVPDLENPFKGDPGSAEWKRMGDFARMWQQYLPDARTGVTILGSEHGMQNWNKGAWGANTEWLPQAYGADPNTAAFDPRKIVQNMINAGFDPSMISPILGPGHGQGYEGSALWTLDDFIGRTLPKASGLGSMAPQMAGSTQGMGTITPRKPRLSQSEAQVAQGGLKWGGQVFGTPEQFMQQYLKPRNQRYADWAAEHPLAAAGFSTRGRAQ